MKLIGMIAVIMMVTVILISWGGVLSDFETNYVDTNISEASPVNSSFKEDYDDRAEEINDTFSPLKDKIDDLGSSDGFLDVVGDGSVVLPKLIISLPGMVLGTFTSAGSDMVNMLNLIGIPTELVLIAIVLLSLVAVFKIVEMIRRYDA